MKFRLPLFALFLLFAFAYAGPASAHRSGPCRADVEKLCPNLPKGPQLRECIQKNKDNFSAECKEFKKQKREAWKACKADKEKFCSNVEHGGGRVKACLQSHEKELAGECRSLIQQKMQEKKTSLWEAMKAGSPA